MKRLVITIDGPAGAGKTTASRALADRLGYKYIDTGALYRAVAYEAMSRKIAADDDKALMKLCAALDLKFVFNKNDLRLFSGDFDITDRIRTPEITMLASAVSARAQVREYLLGLQRGLGKQKGVVVEGRDMGTVVFPDADVKFFLDASRKVRVRRRYDQFKSTNTQKFKEVEKDLVRRDRNDSTRSLAPLKPAPDAILINSTDLSISEVVELMLSYIKLRQG